MRPGKTSWDYMRQAETSWDYQRLAVTTCEPSVLSDVSGNMLFLKL